MPDFAQEAMPFIVPDEQGLAMAHDQVASTNGRFDLNLGTIGRLAATGFSTVVAFFAAEVAPTFADSSSVATTPAATVGHAATASNCIFGSPNFNTVACGPHGPVATHCLAATKEAPAYVLGKYVDGSPERANVIRSL